MRGCQPAAAVLAGVVAGCAGQPIDLSAADTENPQLARVVDSKKAHALLVELLSVTPSRYESSAQIEGAAQPSSMASTERRNTASQPLPTQERLHAIGADASMDFAALTFAQSLLADDHSQPAQRAFAQALEDGPEASEAWLRRPGAFPYTVLFAPGWLYESHSASGADFAAQRRAFERLGLAHRLIPTQQDGSVENNAAVVAQAVREVASERTNVILVSASKASADVAYALTRLLAPDELTHVVGWLNAGGALRGTPLADKGLRPPTSWIVSLAFRIKGWSLDGVNSMRSQVSRSRFDSAWIPEWIAVVNLVAVPVSGTVGRQVRGGYWAMRKEGPTDGVVPIADSVWPGGVNIVALGSDHLLTEFREDRHGLALLRALDFAVRSHAARLETYPLLPQRATNAAGPSTP
jgi:hypothetical protein